MTEYINYWKNYVNFTDRTSRRGYWMPFLFNVIIGFVVGIIGLEILTTLWSLATLLPGLGIAVRRLRDAGKHWAWIFINFVPLVGLIIFIVFLCKRSVPDDGTPVV